VKLLHFLSRKVGEPMRGVIVSVNAEGFFVRGLELPADGLVPVHALPADRYFFERSGQMLIGHKRENRFRLGDELTVAIDHVDLARRTLLYRFVENHSLAAHSELEPVIARPKSAREAERKMAGKNDRKSRVGKSFKGKGAKGKKGGGRAKPGKKPKRR
jgi:ribonuclease R